MNIGIRDIYGSVYEQDRLFDLNSCSIGENLLLPGIKLRIKLQEIGHEFHTLDMYSLNDVDVAVFQEVPDSILTLTTIKELISYMKHAKWKQDYLFTLYKKKHGRNLILLILEPPAVSNKSYNKKFHKYFDKVLTWNDEWIDNVKYFKVNYPQPVPNKKYEYVYDEKKFVTMICGNKTSNFKNELYSERRKVIDYFETYDYEFDLYGFGWEKEHLKNYRGSVDSKLDTLARYKFSICYENNTNINGYITEKIFDCFFARCVPVYWGADNVTDYIPGECFIDRRGFNNIQDVCKYLESITEDEYNCYIENIEKFLKSNKFSEIFSVDAYVDNMVSFLLK